MAAQVEAGPKRSPWERAMAKFGAYFEEQGLGAADVPAAIVIHEVCAAAAALCESHMPCFVPWHQCMVRVCTHRLNYMPCLLAPLLLCSRSAQPRPACHFSPPPLPALPQQVVGLVMATAFWASCYAVRPSQTVARPLVAAAARSRQGAAMQAAYDRAMAQATATVQRLSWLRAVSAPTGAMRQGRVVGFGVCMDRRAHLNQRSSALLCNSGSRAPPAIQRPCLAAVLLRS